jgi:hypothetical protein
VTLLYLEILRAGLTVDQEAESQAKAEVFRFQELLKNVQRERDWYQRQTEDLQSQLKRSVAMYNVLVEFLAQNALDELFKEVEA